MANPPYPTLTPESTTSKSKLSPVGAFADVITGNPFKIYSDPASTLYSESFITGSVQQVAYTFSQLGGKTMDIEINDCDVYTAYEDAVMEYSYQINLHQAYNALGSSLGGETTGFDQNGEYLPGNFSTSMGGVNAALTYPRFDYAAVKNHANWVATETGLGGDTPIYSASFDVVRDIQDYDLQEIVSSSAAAAGGLDYDGLIGDKRISIRRVYYNTGRAQWRFYGFYGGIGTLGNLSSYGQFSDDSTFQIIPVWQNKAQAAAYEDAVRVRTSQYSYEIKDNKIRIYPTPRPTEIDKVWFHFTVDQNPFYGADVVDGTGTATGPGTDAPPSGGTVSNINNIPFSNLPYDSINQFGKKWIKNYAFATAMEILGRNRSKFTTIPIPGESVTLNGPALLQDAKDEKNRLKDFLAETLKELTYDKLAEKDASMAESAEKVLMKVPRKIFIG